MSEPASGAKRTFHIVAVSEIAVTYEKRDRKIAKLEVRVILQKPRCVQSQRADADSERKHQLLEGRAGLVK